MYKIAILSLLFVGRTHTSNSHSRVRHVALHILLYNCIYFYRCVYVHMYIYIYIYICIYLEREREIAIRVLCPGNSRSRVRRVALHGLHVLISLIINYWLLLATTSYYYLLQIVSITHMIIISLFIVAESGA